MDAPRKEVAACRASLWRDIGTKGVWIRRNPLCFNALTSLCAAVLCVEDDESKVSSSGSSITGISDSGDSSDFADSGPLLIMTCVEDSDAAKKDDDNNL